MARGANPAHLEVHSVAATEVGEMTHANPGDHSYQQLACKLTSCRVEKGGQRSTLEVMVSWCQRVERELVGEGGPVGMVLRDKSAPSDCGDLGRERRQGVGNKTPELLRLRCLRWMRDTKRSKKAAGFSWQ